MISHTRLSLTVFATLLLCGLTATAQPSAAPAAKPGTISGRVVTDNGRPLPNAHVMVRRMGSLDTTNTMTTTDREGKFEFTGLDPVSYQVFAFAQGYAPRLRDFNDSEVDVYRTGDFVTRVLTKGGVITGTVTDQSGEPVVGVRVRALLVQPNVLPFPYNQIGSGARTDDRGIYRIYGLGEGTYVVWAGGGGGPASMDVDPFDGDVPTYAPASTRDTAQEIVVRSGAETSNIDIQYRGEPGHVVSGRVSAAAADQPPWFSISLVSANGPEWETRTFQQAGQRGFKIEAVDDGDYYLFAMAYRSAQDWMLSAAKPLKIRNGDVTGVELLVQPLSSLTGRVVLEETKLAQCTDKQRPVFTETLITAQSNEWVTLQRAVRFLWPTANADERGNFLLKDLPSGRYYFTTQYFGKDWYLKSLSLGPLENASIKPGKLTDASRTWTTLKPGERLNGFTITLVHGAASVEGRLALSRGETVPDGLSVYLIPAESDSLDDPLRFHAGPVTAEGRFALTSIAPGHYLVLAQRATDEPALTRLRSPDAAAYRTKLRHAAATMKTEVELKPCQKLTDLRVPVKDN